MAYQLQMDFTTRGNQLKLLRAAVLPTVELNESRKVTCGVMKPVLNAIDSRAARSDEDVKKSGWGTCWVSESTLAIDAGVSEKSVERALEGLNSLGLLIEDDGPNGTIQRRICYAQLADYKVDWSKKKKSQKRRKSNKVVDENSDPGSERPVPGSEIQTLGPNVPSLGPEFRTQGRTKKKEDLLRFTEGAFSEGPEIEGSRGKGEKSGSELLDRVEGEESRVERQDSLNPGLATLDSRPSAFEAGYWNLQIEDLQNPEIIERCYRFAVQAGWIAETIKTREMTFALASHFHRTQDQTRNPQGFFRDVLSQGYEAMVKQCTDAEDFPTGRKLMREFDGVEELPRTSNLERDLNESDDQDLEAKRRQLITEVYRILGDQARQLSTESRDQMLSNPQAWWKANQQLLRRSMLVSGGVK